ncbi:Transcriptional regulator, LysR family [Sulfitobacter noctilucicola]|uniref:DNA-binding transcriptional LysR family regulator n=1 Tax=Sulfitobacter noctilucicola TaxID=1342301 RepID=A0A7W6M9K1_9RHOB|nr:LysR family transcriptional regulator [Sulfitobacter noctilucicola]KIN63535.1 Transcriptional regulator, LysR family [Sulfitobacter noctilucicola]MBB4174956.1 DNA-binding transcriptional LysR family regulator [Sulfitobacter noctilucicola]
MLNATWLDTFTTLCDVGHFTRTAELLGMTQPGVSQHLNKLTIQVGKPLIIKDGKSFTLTPAGDAVLAIGVARRQQERELQEAIQADDPDAGTVSIGSSGSIAMWLYPHLLERMHRAPKLVINVTAAPHATILASVLSGTFDLGIVAEPTSHPRLDAQDLTREELCLVVPRSFAGRQVHLPMLDELGFVAHPDAYGYADDLFSLNFKDTYKGADRLRVRTFVNQIGQIPIPVAQGLGYTILPRSGVDAFAGKADLAIIQLPKRRFQDLRIISRKGRSDIARVAALGKLITRAAVALQ